MKLIEDLFQDKPNRWGLRGDPHMWQELRNSLNRITKNLNQIEFEEELEKQFYRIVQQKGKQISNETVWFESFPQFGMSGGSISMKWWQETGLPWIKEKYKELTK